MTAKKTILVVDDEPKIVEVVASFLENHGYRVLTAEDGQTALRLIQQENIALMLLDLMMPEMSGEDVCRKVRQFSRLPIIMLTAKVGEAHLLNGFQLGADDYIAKPFSLKELLVRVEAVLRRSQSDLMPLSVKNVWQNGDLVTDFEKNVVLKKNEPVNLTPSEMRILSTLIKYPGKVFTRDELADMALGSEFEGYNRTIDSHIRNLRQKIEDNPKTPVYVLTVHGLGYKFGG